MKRMSNETSWLTETFTYHNFHDNMILGYTIYISKISAVTRLIIQVSWFHMINIWEITQTNNIKNAYLCCFIFTRSTNLQKTYVFHIQSEKLMKKTNIVQHTWWCLYVYNCLVYLAVINDISKTQMISFCIHHM